MKIICKSNKQENAVVVSPTIPVIYLLSPINNLGTRNTLDI